MEELGGGGLRQERPDLCPQPVPQGHRPPLSLARRRPRHLPGFPHALFRLFCLVLGLFTGGLYLLPPLSLSAHIYLSFPRNKYSRK